MSGHVLETTLTAIDDKVKFAAAARTNPEIVIDFFPPFGSAEGYTSLELLISSLASCISSTLLIILRKQMNRSITAYSVCTKGHVKETHPKALSKIELDLSITSADTQEEDVAKTLVALEEKLCPVWAMLKGNVEVEVRFSITR
jgi:putative redox protein